MMTLPARQPGRDWNVRAVDLGPYDDDRRCTCCGKVLEGAARMLELDQRIDAYHDFGGVPEAKSQGWFPFGLTCSHKARTAARAKLDKLNR